MDATQDDHAHAQHLVPYRTYVNVWLGLILLTCITVGAAYTDLRHLAVFAAIVIACTKSLLVILYFMHILYEHRIFTWFLVAALGAYAVFLILTFSDYSFPLRANMILASRKVIESVDNAWYWLGGISLFLFLGILGCLIFFVIKYHRSRHPKSADIHGNFKLEILWTVLPTLLSVWLFFIGLEGFQLMRDPPADAYVIEAQGAQWEWTFTYPEEDVSTTDELFVPVNTPVRLNLSSPIGDVIHSLYLPDFRVKEDCVPGLDTYLWFEADRVTTTLEEYDDPRKRANYHNIFCAEFCGKEHAQMLGRLYVLPEEDFETWLGREVAERYRPVEIEKVLDPDSEELVALDAKSTYAARCASCHGLGGEGGLVGGARDFRTLENWKKGTKITDIFRTLTEGLTGTQMRAFDNLSAWDRFALAYRVAAFYEGDDRPPSTRAEFEQLVQDYKLDEPPPVRSTAPIEDTIEAMIREAGGGEDDG